MSASTSAEHQKLISAVLDVSVVALLAAAIRELYAQKKLIPMERWHQFRLEQQSQELPDPLARAGAKMARKLSSAYGVSIDPNGAQIRRWAQGVIAWRDGF